MFLKLGEVFEDLVEVGGRHMGPGSGINDTFDGNDPRPGIGREAVHLLKGHHQLQNAQHRNDDDPIPF